LGPFSARPVDLFWPHYFSQTLYPHHNMPFNKPTPLFKVLELQWRLCKILILERVFFKKLFQSLYLVFIYKVAPFFLFVYPSCFASPERVFLPVERMLWSMV
jgi:hypothetical protein